MSAPATVQRALQRFMPTGLDAHRRKIIHRLCACHTPAMGGIEAHCEHCGANPMWYHGCRDRHCPQCQGRATRRWSERQQNHLLPVPYFHVVFTLPHDLNGWVALHPEVIYRLLFQAVWTTLNTFGHDPKRLNGQIAMSAVLHTWGQNLSRHVHLHCLVPGGALSEDGTWHPARSNYLFPVKALSRHFRGTMVGLLRRAWEDGQLHRVTRPGEVDTMLNRLMAIDWVVYSKHWLKRSATVVEYLARYTHRIAISDARINRVDEHGVTLRYKDYADHDRHKTMTLAGPEFVRRFLLHIVPKGLMRVRHYGFLANRCRKRMLVKVRLAIASTDLIGLARKEPSSNLGQCDSATELCCRQCGRGPLHVRAVLPSICPRRKPPRLIAAG